MKTGEICLSCYFVTLTTTNKSAEKNAKQEVVNERQIVLLRHSSLRIDFPECDCVELHLSIVLCGAISQHLPHQRTVLLHWTVVVCRLECIE